MSKYTMQFCLPPLTLKLGQVIETIKSLKLNPLSNSRTSKHIVLKL